MEVPAPLGGAAGGEHELEGAVEDDLVAVAQAAEDGDPAPVVDAEVGVETDGGVGIAGVAPEDDGVDAVVLHGGEGTPLEDAVRAEGLMDQLDAGTVYANRCDYLDPLLPWVGVKDSGKGCSLSRLGFQHLTRPKSFHLRTRTA